MGGYPADVKQHFPPAGGVFRLELLRAAPNFMYNFQQSPGKRGLL